MLDKKFNLNNIDNDEDLVFFINNGFVVYRNLFEKKKFNIIKNKILNSYENLIFNFKKKKIVLNSDLWSKTLGVIHEENRERISLFRSKKISNILQKYLGPNICLFNHSCVYVNDPELKKFKTSLDIHTDVWTGNSIDSIQLVTFITDSDKNNSINFYPGSHLLGLLPVKNRVLDETRFKLNIKPFALNNILAGDAVIFHPLLLHSSVKRTINKTLRISIGDRLKSLDIKFSNQEKGLGYKVVNNGPLNHIKRIIGNDYLEPLRVYGGKHSFSKINEGYSLAKGYSIENFLNASKKKL